MGLGCRSLVLGVGFIACGGMGSALIAAEPRLFVHLRDTFVQLRPWDTLYPAILDAAGLRWRVDDARILIESRRGQAFGTASRGPDRVLRQRMEAPSIKRVARRGSKPFEPRFELDRLGLRRARNTPSPRARE